MTFHRNRMNRTSSPPPPLVLAVFFSLLLFFTFHSSPAQAQDDDPPDTSIECVENGIQVTCTIQDPPDDEVELALWSINGRPFVDRDDLLGNSFTFEAGCGTTSIRAGGIGVDNYGIQSHIATGETSFHRRCSSGSSGSSGSGSSGSSSHTGLSSVQSVHLPQRILPAGAEVNSDTKGLNYKTVDAAGVGLQWISKLGSVHAIDIWGQQNAQGEVCIVGIGRLLMLDATTAPRAQLWLDSYQREGKTCARFDRPGTVVLIPGEPSAPTTQATTADLLGDFLIADSPNEQMSLVGCRIVANYNLNFRENPARRIMDLVPSGSSFNASARTPNWFKVSYQGRVGWISAHFVQFSSRCG